MKKFCLKRQKITEFGKIHPFSGTYWWYFRGFVVVLAPYYWLLPLTFGLPDTGALLAVVEPSQT